ncbi:MAG: antirestriction protein ArdA [Bacteroidales bacterium]|nr:antirestriction protein ArdA [Bacteroidales bacterium]
MSFTHRECCCTLAIYKLGCKHKLSELDLLHSYARQFARHIVDECYDLDKMLGNLSYYFDYDAFARDLFMCNYHFDNGYVFIDKSITSNTKKGLFGVSLEAFFAVCWNFFV